MSACALTYFGITMAKRYCLLLLMLAAWPLAAQDLSAIQKIKEAIASRNGKEKFNALCQLAWEYRVAQPDSGIYYAKQAFELGKSLTLAGIAEPINLIGLSSYHKGNVLDAYENFKMAMALAEENTDSTQIAHSHNNMGRLFQEQAMMKRSLEHLHMALEIFQTTGDSLGSGFVYHNLGNYYAIENDWSSAETHYNKALAIRLMLGHAHETVSTLLQLGRLHISHKKYDAALRQFLQADSIAGPVPDFLLKADIEEEIARGYLLTQRLNEAERLAADGLNKIEATGNKRLLPKAHLTLGQVLYARGNETLAREHFNQAIAASTSPHDLNTKLEAYFLLWQIARPDARAEMFEYYTHYMNLKDSIRGMEARQRESQLQFQLEIERKDAENAILKAKEERKSFIISVQVVLIIVVVAFAFNLIRGRQKILNANKLLDQKNQEVEYVNNLLAHKTVTLENHMTAIMNFSKNRNIALGNLALAAKDIASITAHKLSISQVSIWLYNDTDQCIETIAGYNLHHQAFVPAMKVHFSDAPQYFSTIKRERLLVSDEARSNPATRELTHSYFEPNNIYSLLDATFSLDGHLRGLLCCEHQHTVRYWTTEDKLFVSSIADIISLALRSAQRLEYEKHIKDQNKKIASLNEVLEERVKQRTQALEAQNKRLSEYAFINSHMLRGPVSRVLGLINLIQREPVARELDLMAHLVKSSVELDQIVKKITMALNDGVPLSIEELKKNEDNPK
jgi:tetratricopeptide (TPR) repeat protein